MCTRTVGLRVNEALKHWQDRYPWDRPSLDELVERIVVRMIGLIGEVGAPLPGARAAVAACHARGLKLALATSSREDLAGATLAKLGMSGDFAQIVCARADGHGKPHPEVFLHAAQALGTEPQRCLVFEDSLNGVIAAKAARMTAVAVPGAQWAADPRFILADHRLASLEAVTPEWLAQVDG